LGRIPFKTPFLGDIVGVGLRGPPGPWFLGGFSLGDPFPQGFLGRFNGKKGGFPEICRPHWVGVGELPAGEFPGQGQGLALKA